MLEPESKIKQQPPDHFAHLRQDESNSMTIAVAGLLSGSLIRMQTIEGDVLGMLIVRRNETIKCFVFVKESIDRE